MPPHRSTTFDNISLNSSMRLWRPAAKLGTRNQHSTMRSICTRGYGYGLLKFTSPGVAAWPNTLSQTQTSFLGLYVQPLVTEKLNARPLRLLHTVGNSA